MDKYIEVLLNTCLKVDKDKPLFISVNIERMDFVRKLVTYAYSIGLKDIYVEVIDPYLKHNALKNLSLEELKKNSMFNKEKWNEYGLKDAAFLMLASEMPGLMDDIDSKKLSAITTYSYETRKVFDDLRDRGKIAWCIAAVPTYSWAKKIFPDSLDPVNDLWNKIFEICSLDQDDYLELTNNKLSNLEKRANLLNKYNFKELKYKNSLGTDLSIGLPLNHIWATGYSVLSNNKKVLVNFPTEEVFTSPNKNLINGIVYSSKPLCYQDNIIENFSLTFKNGKVTEIKAEKGLDILRELVNSAPNMDYLGEVALVEYDSKINNTGLIFYETLFDENASCHLALGTAFPECIKNGFNMSSNELEERRLNYSLNHVDFMVGTKDLDIIGITYDNKEYEVFKDGKFVLKD